MALNANTGRVDPGFGNEGAVEIGINWGGAPYVYKNLIVLGNNNGESTDGPPGDQQALERRECPFFSFGPDVVLLQPDGGQARRAD